MEAFVDMGEYWYPNIDYRALTPRTYSIIETACKAPSPIAKNLTK